MEIKYVVEPIGQIMLINDKYVIKLNAKYKQGLTHLDGFSHIQIVWWAHLSDKPQKRETLIANKLFAKAPDKVGIFSTRAPVRPNPIMISTIKSDEIDPEEGMIHTPYIDAEPGSPVLDIKPYFPMERVKHCDVPEWFRHWPQWSEETANFNWKNEINFD